MTANGHWFGDADVRKPSYNGCGCRAVREPSQGGHRRASAGAVREPQTSRFVASTPVSMVNWIADMVNIGERHADTDGRPVPGPREAT